MFTLHEFFFLFLDYPPPPPLHFSNGASLKEYDIPEVCECAKSTYPYKCNVKAFVNSWTQRNFQVKAS